MSSNYAKRVIGNLQEEGVVPTFKKIVAFVFMKNYYSRRFQFEGHNIKNYIINQIRYDAPANPYKTIKINPSIIKHVLKTDDNGCYLIPRVKTADGGLGQIKSGDWDLPKHRSNFEEHWIFSGLIERFEQGKEWKKTEYYQSYLEHLQDKYITGNTTQPENLEQVVTRKCEDLDDLYNDIKENGYERNQFGSQTGSGRASIPEMLEVMVSIGRNGNIMLWDGKHRFVIARILDINIPVQVICRHKKWQDVRDNIYNNGPSEVNEELRDHPDLKDVL